MFFNSIFSFAFYCFQVIAKSFDGVWIAYSPALCCLGNSTGLMVNKFQGPAVRSILGF